MLNVGSLAPDFALENQTREVIRLSDFRGRKNVVVAFHPFAFTPVCTRQMQSYQAAWPTLDALDVQVLGISTDAGPSKAAWAASMGGLHFHVLSDHHPHGAVASSYGAMGNFGLADRAIFIVDKSGKIAWAKHHGMDDDPSLEELVGALKKLDN